MRKLLRPLAPIALALSLTSLTGQPTRAQSQPSVEQQVNTERLYQQYLALVSPEKRAEAQASVEKHPALKGMYAAIQDELNASKGAQELHDEVTEEMTRGIDQADYMNR